MKIPVTCKIDEFLISALREFLHPEVFGNNGVCSKEADSVIRAMLTDMFLQACVKAKKRQVEDSLEFYA